MEPESGPPSLERVAAVATIRLRRPSHANRVETADLKVLLAHCDALRRDSSIRAVVLTASGKQFSAGFDLSSSLGSSDPAPRLEGITASFAAMVDAFEALPQVTVCALNGGVYGGATDLALACDFRYGVTDARMCMPVARIGLQFYPSGLRRYASRLGVDNAKRLFLLGETLDAQRMLAIGFLHAVVEPDELMTIAAATAKRAASMAPMAVSGIKQALNALASGSLDVDETLRTEALTMRSQDLREGVAAWHEKREPMFRGS